MNAGTESAFEALTEAQLFSDAGLKILRNALTADLPADFALVCVASVAIEKTTRKVFPPERIQQITDPLMAKPKVRGRLRQAGYTIKIRGEVEFSYMMEAI